MTSFMLIGSLYFSRYITWPPNEISIKPVSYTHLDVYKRQVYDENLKIYRDWRNTLEYAVEEAEVKGLKKGKLEGIAEGKAEGIAEGQRQIAANFKNQGVNIETIAQCTGLSVEEINGL